MDKREVLAAYVRQVGAHGRDQLATGAGGYCAVCGRLFRKLVPSVDRFLCGSHLAIRAGKHYPRRPLPVGGAALMQHVLSEFRDFSAAEQRREREAQAWLSEESARLHRRATGR